MAGGAGPGGADPGAVLRHVVEVTTRVEGALVFTIVRFVYSLLSGGIPPATVVYLSTVVAFLASAGRSLVDGLQLGVGAVRTVQYLARLLEKFGALVAVQALISSVQPEDLASASAFQQTECFTVSLSILLLSTVLPRAYRESEDGGQFLRLVLYMFASNTQFVVQRVNFGWTLPFLSAAGFVLLFRVEQRGVRSEVVRTLASALTLSLTNMMILASWTVTVGSNDRVPQLVQLLSLLVVFDALAKVFPEFRAMRDYAVWQGASQVYALVLYAGADQMQMVVVAVCLVLFLQAVRRAFPSSDAMTELSVLLLINLVLGMIRTAVMTLHRSDTVIIIVMWIMVIDVAVAGLKSLGR